MSQLELLRSCIPEDKQSEVERLFSEKGLVETVCHLWEDIWTDEEKLQAENDTKTRNEKSKYYKLLFIEFNIKEHYNQVDSHRHFVQKAYNRLKDFVPNMKKEDAEKHDLSKYDFSQAIGYTVRWVHMTDNDVWKKSLDDHYKREHHHPQNVGQERMSQRYLEESLIDMVGSRWERNLKGDENAKNSDLVDFHPQYLTRYHKEDLKVKYSFYSCIDYGHSGCGGAGVLNHPTGTFATQHYNGHTQYRPNSQCTWKIHASAGKVVRLSATAFHIEDDANCDYDFVAVYDGSSKSSKLIGKFCGRDEVEVVSSGRYLFVEFVSDDSTQFNGFRMRYKFQQASAGCGKHLYKCDTQLCIARDFLCDSEDDCGDSSDERPKMCQSQKSSSCLDGEFLCGDGGCF
ncbi:CUBN [Mytilus coruscus]|uniref:CUBN n=1 Tax=Mytilus coruscus TaxID=42192 RepID=A0A6J8BHH9_MYTCO|nr:CUBN [Mytilus coruscus]